MKRLYFLLLLIVQFSWPQCGESTFCNGNTGLYSDDDATNIAYDNIGSAFHSTYIKEPTGAWKVWGESMGGGYFNALSPRIINTTNYSALTGTIYKVGMGSAGYLKEQLIVLTSTGLFVCGVENTVVPTPIVISSGFQKITINGKLDGLPTGVNPQDVKMLFVSNKLLIITTCSGAVFVLSPNFYVRGSANIGSAVTWSRVMENATTPLSNVIVARGTANIGFALKADGTLWTWGVGTYIGNGTIPTDRNFAAPMTMPAGIPGIKMIQATNGHLVSKASYYVLGTDKKIYSLGENASGQLGDRTAINRLSWVNAKNPDDSIIDDAAWISSNEHDNVFPGLAVIKLGGILYTAGDNNSYMIGRELNSGINHLNFPNGIASTDVITQVETGGHTCALIKQGSTRYGYVGHRISGSIGNGSSVDGLIGSYDFITPPEIAVCGTNCATPVVTTNSPICVGSDALFTITANPGDTITYKLNSGPSQTVVIGAAGQVQLTITNPVANQDIQLTFILGAEGACSNSLSQNATVNVRENVTPLFTQVPQICAGDALNPLPLISLNSIAGSWSPALNNNETTTYTFTPSSTECAFTTAMTITVLPIGNIPSFAPVAPVCMGDALNPLPAISIDGIEGSWSPAVNNQATTTYTFMPLAINACTPNATMTIEVLVPVVPVFNQIAPVCAGDNFQLPALSTNGISGTWSPAINNQQTTTYTFTGNIGICAQNATMTVVINPKITPLFQSVAPICEGSLLAALPEISDNGIPGNWSPAINNLATTTYTFTPLPTECAFTATMTITVSPIGGIPSFNQMAPLCMGDALNSLPTISNDGIEGNWSPAVSNQATTTYTFTPLPINACTPNATMTVEVLVPVVPVFNQIAPVCEGENLQLPALSTNGISGTWNPAVNNQQTTTYTFTGNIGSCAENVTMTVVINPKITPVFQSVTPVCAGSLLPNLPQVSDNNIPGNWSPAINNQATTIYTFTPDIGICANPSQLTIVINPKINPLFPEFGSVCFGDPAFVLPTVSNNNIHGTWEPSFNNLQTGTYTFIPENSACANSVTSQVGVFEEFDFELMRYCESGNLFLQAVPTSGNFESDNASFNWQYNNTTIGSQPILNLSSYLASTTINETLPITFTAIVNSQDGCSKSKTITLQSVYCDIQRGISPNGDHLNDTFDLRSLDVSYLNIFNRYGVKVYGKANYFDEWHGQADNGTDLPDGTYYYQIDFETAPSKTGWIYLNIEN